MIEKLFESNRAWSEGKVAADPEFFLRLVAGQSPDYLWIGCSDSRVPANELVGCDAGEMFVHRNVANLCSPQDLNFLTVLQFAVDVLKVPHILVVGHYGCRGVLTALEDVGGGLVDHWIAPVRAVAERGAAELEALGPEARHDRLAELNALHQAKLVEENPILIAARARGQTVAVHAWVYSLKTGLIKDLNLKDHVYAASGAGADTALV